MRCKCLILLMVPGAGVEPARGVSPPDFESGASANFAIPAHVGQPKDHARFRGKESRKCGMRDAKRGMMNLVKERRGTFGITGTIGDL